MRFRLTYNGSLKAGGNIRPAHTDKRLRTSTRFAENSPTLKHLWSTNRFLSTTKISPRTHESFVASGWRPMVCLSAPETLRRWSMCLARSMVIPDIDSFPLVRKRGLPYLLLTRFSFLKARFSSSRAQRRRYRHRLKTLVDALRMPSASEECRHRLARTKIHSLSFRR